MGRNRLGEGKHALRDGDVERFFRYVHKGDDPNACHLWMGSRRSNGYGQFGIRDYPFPAHRVAYLIAHGELPHDMDVLHVCDVPACVNPSHLWLGTAKDNARDMCQKGRQGGQFKPGDTGHATITREDVIVIRNAFAVGESAYELAIRYGMTFAQIYRICRGQAWADVGGPIAPLGQRGKRDIITARLRFADIERIRTLAAEGVSHLHIAEQFGMSRSNVGMIVARKTWKHVA